MSNMVTVTIDGKTVQVPQGMNLVEAARLAGIEIPVFCYHPKLDPAGVCRMCLVQVEKLPKPVTACTTPCSDGMVVHTKTETVEQVRKGVLEFTLINHPLDCPVCDKGGECDLQDLTFSYGATGSRLHDGKLHKNKAAKLGPFIVLDEERCILCRRCVRFDDQIAQEKNLVIKERGVHNVVATTKGQPYDSYFSGNTVEICPVGALTSQTYRFKARPWDLNKVQGVCTGCSVGCSVEQHYRFGQLLRLEGRDNSAVNDGWLCDRGRYNHQFVHGEQRARAPLVKRNGEFVEVTWLEAWNAVIAGFRQAIAAKGPESVGVIGGGRLTVEEAYLLQKFARAALGTGNVDYRVSGQLISSHAGFPGAITDIDDATLVLVANCLPAEQAPVLDLRIRKASERGKAKVVAVGSAMAHYRSRSKSIVVPPGEVAGVLQDADLTSRVVAEPKVVAVWDGRNAAVGQALLQLLAAVKAEGNAAHLLIVGAQANDRGAEYAGLQPGLLPGLAPVAETSARAQLGKLWGREVPAAGRDTASMLQAAAQGDMAALYLVSANLLNTYPDGQLAQEALARVPFLVVQDLFLTETAKLAHVVLPAAAFPAKSGRYVSLEGRVNINEAAMAPEFDTITDGEIIAGLAAACGVELAADPAAVWAELQQIATVGDTTPGLPAAVAESIVQQAAKSAASAVHATPPAAAGGPSGSQAGGTLLVVPVERLFAGGGTAAFDPAMERVRPEAVAIMHPTNAAALQLADGDLVVLQTADTSLQLTTRINAEVAPGTVQIVKGLPQAPANLLGAVATVRPVAEQRAREVV